MNRTVYTLCAVQFLDAIGLGLLLPILPFWIQDYGASEAQVTQLVALYAAMGVICSPIAGRLSDRVSRKSITVAATLCTAIAYVSFLHVETLTGIFLVRAFTGIMASKGGVVSAWLLENVQEAERSKYLGLLGSMTGVGMLLGPLLATGILQAVAAGTYTPVFVCAGFLSAAAGLALLAVPERSRRYRLRQPATTSKSLNQPDLLFLNFSLFLVFSVVLSVSALYMQHQLAWDARAAGLAIGAMTGCMAICRFWLAHHVIGYLGKVRAAGHCTAASAICLGLCVTIQHPAFFLGFYLLCAMCYAIAAIGITVLMSDRVPERTLGEAMGRLNASASAAIVLGAGTHGQLFSAYGPNTPFLLYSLVVLVIASCWYSKTLSRTQEEIA